MVEFSGFLNGKWGEPTPGENNNPVFAGVETHTFNWGVADYGEYPNELSFIINPFSISLDSPFQVGNLIYYNGISYKGTEVEAVPLELELELFNPNRITEDFEFEFDIVSTPNNGTSEENADYIYPVNKIPNNVFTVNGIDYRIELLGFSQDNGQTITKEFHVWEEATTSAGLFAKIEVNPTSGSSGNDTISGSLDNDYLTGKKGEDILRGKAGNDYLSGDEGNDKLFGEAGNDVLSGGKGKDILTGGAGSDHFILAASSGADRITDFQNGIDKLQLTGNLTFGKLRIVDLGADTQIKFGTQVLANLLGVDNSGLITANDFVF